MPDYQRVCLIHYHEIGLKGHNRGSFERCLLSNVAHALARFPGCGVNRISGHLIVEVAHGADIDEVAWLLSRQPGVVKVSLGLRTERDLDQITDAACQLMAGFDLSATFKVAARRSNTDFPHDSMEMNRVVGAAVQRAFPSIEVDCEDPGVIINVQVIQSFGYVFAHVVHGVGGLPVGSAGKVVSLLSAGIDSPVATWKMVRRGAVAVCTHFSGRPQTSAASEHLVRELIDRLQVTSGIGRLYIFAIGDYQREISLTVPPKLTVIMYRRLMFKVAESIAYREKAGALVTGESLGQVASQTLDNIRATDEVVSLPVFRPLIGSDKEEIVERARELDTYRVSIQNDADCCTLFMPRKPETHAKLDEVHAAWSLLPVDEWVSRIVEDATVEDMDCPRFHR